MGVSDSKIVETDSNGTMYVGPYIYDTHIRIGKLITNNYEYEGEIIKAGNIKGKLLYLMNGEGICAYKDGTVEKGQFDFGRLHGPAKITKNGVTIAKGIFESSRIKSGFYFTVNGDKVISNDFQTGSVKIEYVNGDFYEGSYKNEKRNGEGTLFTKNISYFCKWENDLKNGKGFQIENNIQTKKYWENDIEKEQFINIKCPECNQKLCFLISNCNILEK